MASKVTIMLVAVVFGITIMAPMPYFQENGAAQAQETSLAGNRGKVKRRLPRGHGQCAQAVRDYIDAPGHSAYASTFANDWSSGRGFICGSALNRTTTEEAEDLAIRSCEAGKQKWKNVASGKCEIAASK